MSTTSKREYCRLAPSWSQLWFSHHEIPKVCSVDKDENILHFFLSFFSLFYFTFLQNPKKIQIRECFTHQEQRAALKDMRA